MLFIVIQWCFLGWWWVIHVFDVMWCEMLNGFSMVQSREESSGSCWQDATIDKIQLFLQLLRLSWIKKKREFISVTTHAYTWLGVDWKQRDGAQTVAVVFSGNLGSCQTGILFLHASSSWVASIYSQSIMIQIVIVNRIIYYKRINKPKLCADAECRLCLRVSGSYDCLLSICRIPFETLAKIFLHSFLCFVNGHWKVYSC